MSEQQADSATEVLACDIAIVGGAMAGSALACALADSGWRVAVIETAAARPFSPAEFFDARVVALSESSRALLDRLGVWESIRAARVSPYRYMEVWDGEGTAAVQFDAAEIGQPALGHIVENGVIVHALQARLRQAENVQWLCPDSVRQLEDGDSGARLLLHSGRSVQAGLVIAADGALSSLRQQAGIKTLEWDYGHTAVVATVRTAKPHGDTARQRFIPSGPLAFLPLRGCEGDPHWHSIVWSTAPEQVDALMQLSDSAFSQQLAQTFEHRLGDVLEVRNRFAFPLRQRHAQVYHKGHVVLVGDAAHTIHPLAGQGVNLGFMDVQVLAEELLQARRKGLPPAHPRMLARYQRRRHGANLAMTATMELFKRLFARRELPWRWLRNTGMRGVDYLPGLKREIMRRAMGL